MKPFVAEIVKDSKRLLREVVAVCSDFPQRHRFILAERMVALSMDGLLRAQDAARLGDKRAAEQRPVVLALIEHNDKLQAMLEVAYELQCFKSTGQYEAILRVATKIGAQAGGWLKRINGLVSAPLPIQQNLAGLAPRERLGALSTGVASAEANS